MYNEFFGFQERPFNSTPDPRFFYANPANEEAYASLLYGIRERKGFITLIGEVGTGKTTLLRRLMTNLEEPNHFVYLCYSTPSFDEFLSFICADLELRVEGKGYLGKIQALNECLLKILREGGTGVLLVDEAQNLGDLVLENLRLLSNLETSREKLLQIILVGQPELERKLAQQKLRQLKQRIAIQCRLDRLREREIGSFILARLRIAAYKGENPFPAETVQCIAFYSKGIPRLINIICDNALLIAYSTSQKIISPQIIEEVARDLQLNMEAHNRGTVREEGTGVGGTWRDSSIGSDGQEIYKQRITRPEFSIEKADFRKNSVLPSSFQSKSTFSRTRSNVFRVAGGVVVGFFLLSALGIKAEDLLSTLRATVSAWILPATRLVTEQSRPDSGREVIKEKQDNDAKTPSQIQSQEVPSSSGPSTALAGQTAPRIASPEVESDRNDNGKSLPGEIPPLRENPSSGRLDEEQKSPSPVLSRLPESLSSFPPSNAWANAQPIIAQSGTTVVEIVLRNYKSYNLLAIDLVKEFNPHIKDLDRIQSGEKIWLPPLTQETLLRKQSDGSYQLILATFRSLPEAKKLAQGVRQKGYRTAILPQKVTGKFSLQRVVIERLADLSAVDRAWELFDTHNFPSGASVSGSVDSSLGSVAIR